MVKLGEIDLNLSITSSREMKDGIKIMETSRREKHVER